MRTATTHLLQTPVSKKRLAYLHKTLVTKSWPLPFTPACSSRRAPSFFSTKTLGGCRWGRCRGWHAQAAHRGCRAGIAVRLACGIFIVELVLKLGPIYTCHPMLGILNIIYPRLVGGLENGSVFFCLIELFKVYIWVFLDMCLQCYKTYICSSDISFGYDYLCGYIVDDW